MPSGIFKLTGLPLDPETIDCDVKLEDEKVVAMLKEALKPKKKKPEKKENEGAPAKKPETKS
jgi:hypothetical protein